MKRAREIDRQRKRAREKVGRVTQAGRETVYARDMEPRGRRYVTQTSH